MTWTNRPPQNTAKGHCFQRQNLTNNWLTIVKGSRSVWRFDLGGWWQYNVHGWRRREEGVRQMGVLLLHYWKVGEFWLLFCVNTSYLRGCTMYISILMTGHGWRRKVSDRWVCFCSAKWVNSEASAVQRKGLNRQACFCSAKWVNSVLPLQSGWTHSNCHSELVLYRERGIERKVWFRLPSAK